MKVTYQTVMDSRIPAAVGACATDPRLLALTNEGLERLMYEGHWHNTTQRVRFCAVDGCITQPPQIAAIEKVAVCGQPATLRTQWHEFLADGMGIRSNPANTGSNTNSCCNSSGMGCGMNEAIFRGYFCVFADIIPTGNNKKVNLVCDLASDVGKNVLLLGYDANGNWIRTNQGGVILDGELVPLDQGAGTTSTNFFSSLTGVQLNVARDGQVWAYEYNTDTTTKRMIGQYQSFETNPDYARYYFPGIQTGSAVSNGSCTQTLVEAIVKLNFWPVKVATDYLCVPCIPALKEMLQALNDAENEPDGIKKKQLIAAGVISARAILDKQLQHFTGDGNEITMSVTGSAPYTDPIYAPI